MRNSFNINSLHSTQSKMYGNYIHLKAERMSGEILIDEV